MVPEDLYHLNLDSLRQLSGPNLKGWPNPHPPLLRENPRRFEHTGSWKRLRSPPVMGIEKRSFSPRHSGTLQAMNDSLNQEKSRNSKSIVLQSEIATGVGKDFAIRYGAES